jgi:2-polyprenyl-3-methyl-5-hydroxy-6-metoxy-1,4-benzoquinol methylase
MSGCCDPRGCDRMFDGRFARRMASRYRRRGLDRTAGRMVALLAESGLEGATVLEIGGGVGEIHVELLRRGAASATALELSPAYEEEAARLLAEAGLTDRVRRRLSDIAAEPEAVEPADIVVLHRVVCCYPDYAKLLGAAADHTRRQLVFSHPPRNPMSRAVVATQNLVLRLSGRKFRVFVHPPAAMLAVLADRGLRAVPVPGGRLWRVATATR